ncbi:hypothetical protein D9M71_616630 [compost metagenome]
MAPGIRPGRGNRYGDREQPVGDLQPAYHWCGRGGCCGSTPGAPDPPGPVPAARGHTPGKRPFLPRHAGGLLRWRGGHENRRRPVTARGYARIAVDAAGGTRVPVSRHHLPQPQGHRWDRFHAAVVAATYRLCSVHIRPRRCVAEVGRKLCPGPAAAQLLRDPEARR